MSAETDQLLREGALRDRVIVIARAAGAGTADADAGAAALAGDRCRALGARVFDLVADPADEEACAAGVAGIMNWHGSIDILVNDADSGFEAALAAGQDGMLALRSALDAAWVATRAVANAAFIHERHGGRLIGLAPRQLEGVHPGREAARAALENMARTLSIEWARFGVRTTAILPGARTDPAEVAALVAFLSSDAGDYYSGCALALGGPERGAVT